MTDSSKLPAQRRSDAPRPFQTLAGRLAVVSNRLPVRLAEEDGRTVVRPGSGGLVTALNPVLRQLDGLWIGWDGAEVPGANVEAIERAADAFPYRMHTVSLDEGMVEGFYRGFANGTLWPLFHDFMDRASFSRDTWDVYQRANRRFADVILRETTTNDVVWVQDYHLCLAGREVRRREERRLVWFLHIPFPPPNMFSRLPWRRELLEALLCYDLVGFQTRRDLNNFLDCVRMLVPQATVLGWGGSSLRHLFFEGREVRAGWFPISIDFSEFDDLARSPEVSEKAWLIHAQLPERTLVLGVDRLDYTKGIPERLQALERFLELYPDHHGKVTLIQVCVPSREDVPEYRRMRDDLERLVGRINGRFTREGWVPVHYIYRSLSRPELVAYYRTCEVALITPLRDGMNLVAKEYCAASVDRPHGVLILSEFAGAAAQLAGPSLIVNPHNTDQVAEALHRAMLMPQQERADRIRRLRRQLREHDVARWARDFGRAAGLELPEARGPSARLEAGA